MRTCPRPWSRHGPGRGTALVTARPWSRPPRPPAGQHIERMIRLQHDHDRQTITTASTTARLPRLKKDGTIDRRNGNPGNKGNKHATGRKAVPGQAIRKTVGYYASKQESDCLKIYIKILHYRPDVAAVIERELGTPPPEGTPAPPRKRKSYTCMLLEAEREPVKRVLSIIKDRLQASKAILENYI